MLRQDLSGLSDENLARVRLFGPRPNESDRFLEGALIAMDDRLDGPDNRLRGTRNDFPQRAMRFFSENVLSLLPYGDIEVHRDASLKLLKKMRFPKAPPHRVSATDEEICSKLDQFWRKADGRSTKLLRLLRDRLLIACEQGRFQRLYGLVAQQRSQS